jgi:hypothetical protein
MWPLGCPETPVNNYESKTSKENFLPMPKIETGFKGSPAGSQVTLPSTLSLRLSSAKNKHKYDVMT